MTFDDGSNSGMTFDEDFRAKINALLQEKNVSFEELCKQTNISQDLAYRALEEGTYGLPRTIPILQRLVTPLGVDVDWLIIGVAPRESAVNHNRLETRTLVWEFILGKADFPWQHRKPLLDYVMNMLAEKTPTNSMKSAARSESPPRTILDVAYLYERLLQSGTL